MSLEYILNMIKGILAMRVVGSPNCVTRNELVRAVADDLDMVIEQLIEEGHISEQEGLNDTLFYLKKE